jgi:hypothetical protein
MVGIGGIADMNGRIASANSVEFDPTRSLAGQSLLCCTTQLLFNDVVGGDAPIWSLLERLCCKSLRGDAVE